MQKDAAKEGFKLNPIDVSYPFTMDLERLANYIVVCQIPNIDKFGQVCFWLCCRAVSFH
jgi:hypothetical protein